MSDALAGLFDRLSPGNIEPRDGVVHRFGGAALGIFNPSPAMRTSGTSVCLGEVQEDCTDWHRPGAPEPVGTYAIFRAHDGGCECLTDMMGTRTVWYVARDDLFAAATSQRLLAMVLGDVEPNEPVISWMIATGSLGHGNGWDRRVKPLPAAHRLRFDAADWSVTLSPSATPAAPAEEDARSTEAFHDLLTTTVAAYELDPRRWVLPLSGGVDSRGLLFGFASTQGLRTVTWGESHLRHQKGTDGQIAAEVARRVGVANEFLEIAATSEPAETVLDRFARCSEGTADHIAGYVDGFAVWKTLFENQIGGVIRGDEAFGWVDDLASEERPRRSVGLHLPADYQNLGEIRTQIPPIEPPQIFERRSGETLPAFRDRLYREFRVPVILSALNKMKTPFVEVFNPWLSQPIMAFVPAMPDALRTDKKAFRDFVARDCADIPFAYSAAMNASEDFLVTGETADFMRTYLGDGGQSAILPAGVTNAVLDQLKKTQEKPNSSRWLRRQARRVVERWLPDSVMFRIKRGVQSRLPAEKLAFRAYLIEHSIRLLNEDAAAGRAAVSGMSTENI